MSVTHFFLMVEEFNPFWGIDMKVKVSLSFKPVTKVYRTGPGCVPSDDETSNRTADGSSENISS